jgi:hypothetical protein
VERHSQLAAAEDMLHTDRSLVGDTPVADTRPGSQMVLLAHPGELCAPLRHAKHMVKPYQEAFWQRAQVWRAC